MSYVVPLPRPRSKRDVYHPLQGPLTVRHWLALLRPEQVEAMRQWYADRYGFLVDSVSDREAVEQVMRRYPGGVTAFATRADAPQRV